MKKFESAGEALDFFSANRNRKMQSGDGCVYDWHEFEDLTAEELCLKVPWSLIAEPKDLTWGEVEEAIMLAYKESGEDEGYGVKMLDLHPENLKRIRETLGFKED